MPEAKKIVGNDKEEKTENIEQQFSKEKLRSNSMVLFGVTQSTFDGAMFGCKKDNFTLKEAKAIINKWLYGKEGK